MKQTNHSYRTLARAARVAQTPIWKLRHGKQLTCSYPVAERIATALGQPVEELFKPKVKGE